MINESAIVWTTQAKESYINALSFILEKWTLKEAEQLESMTNCLLSQLIINKKLCPKSKIKTLRKCVVSSQTSMIYRVKPKSIEIIAFIDNRSKHSY